MDQTVLVNADVDERAERGHVRHDALQHHARLQVAELLDALLEGRRAESGPGVAPRLLQLLQDVRHGRQSEHVVHEVRRAQRPQGLRVTDQRGHLAARALPHPPHHRVGLGVHAGAVQRVVAAPDPQEARALLVRLRAEARHVLERLAGAERAVGVPVRHDVLRQPRADPRDPGKQRCGSGVDVHADAVHTVLDDRVQGPRELHLGQVVLVLADADRLRVDLHQFGQRVLEPPRDGHRAAQRHVHVGQFLRGERGGGVHRGARLRDHHLGELQLRVLVDQFTGQLVRLTGRRAVADRDQVDRVLLRELRELRQRLVPLVGGHVRVDHIGGHHLAGGVDDRDLHPRTETGVQAQRGPRPGRGGEQQITQIRGEDPDRLVLRRRTQPEPQVDAQVHLDPGPPGPTHGVAQPLVARAAPVGDLEAAGDHVLVRGRARLLGDLRLLRFQNQIQHVLLLAAQHREHPVRGQGGERLREVEVVGELRARLLLAVAHLRRQSAAGPHALAQLAGQVGVLGEPLGEDRACALQGGSRVRHTLVAVHERGGSGERIDRRVPEQAVRQRFESRLPGDLRLRAPLGLERQVDVLQARLGLGRPDARLQRGVELALFAYGFEDRRTPLLQLPQIAQPFLQRAQLRIVEGFGRLLAVARDERHGRSAVEQLDRRPDLSFTYAELLGDPAFDGRRHGFPDSPSRTGCAGRAQVVMSTLLLAGGIPRPALCRVAGGRVA
ncbi:putative transcriptional accessory protein [Streptomyces sp. HCCB10043]|nr:putative transcriptional accessory protein [Streptomyces sp. HCCB10043]